MKITKLPNSIDPKEKEKELATKGCDKCPCCGETKDWLKNGAGIMAFPLTTEEVKFFSVKYYDKMYYRCFTCGAEWESEPYNMR